MDKAVIKAKKVECIIGLFFLLPPVLGVFAFVLQLFDADTDFSKLRDLSSNWTNDYSLEGGGGMSAAPIYLGLMAIAGVYLIKDSFYALFVKNEQNENDLTLEIRKEGIVGITSQLKLTRLFLLLQIGKNE